MANELKPCPFCGGKAYMKITPHIPKGNDYTPQCLDPSCCGRLTKKWADRETAVCAWNRRVPQTVVNQHGENCTHISNCGTLNL